MTGARKASFAPVAGEKTALGYPFLKPYDGETLQYCSGPTTPVTDDRLVGGEQLKPCRMTNGASGGPWYARTPMGEDVRSASPARAPRTRRSRTPPGGRCSTVWRGSCSRTRKRK